MPHIRPATPADLAELLTMVHALARHHDDTPDVTEADLARDLFGAPPWLQVLVAEEGRRLAGYAALQSLSQLQFGRRGMDLHHLFVQPAARGLGLGRALVSASIAHATALGCRYLTVSTHPDNHAAQAFYLALGFAARSAGAPRFALALGPTTISGVKP